MCKYLCGYHETLNKDLTSGVYMCKYLCDNHETMNKEFTLESLKSSSRFSPISMRQALNTSGMPRLSFVLTVV